jgi:hypothetical protein
MRPHLLRLTSFASAFRKFFNSRFPTYSADALDWYPLRLTLTPLGCYDALAPSAKAWVLAAYQS